VLRARARAHIRKKLCAIRGGNDVAEWEFIAKNGDAEVATPVEITAINDPKRSIFGLSADRIAQFLVFWAPKICVATSNRLVVRDVPRHRRRSSPPRIFGIAS